MTLPSPESLCQAMNAGGRCSCSKKSNALRTTAMGSAHDAGYRSVAQLVCNLRIRRAYVIGVPRAEPCIAYLAQIHEPAKIAVDKCTHRLTVGRLDPHLIELRPISGHVTPHVPQSVVGSHISMRANG